jgi:CRP-like cAMP-binding protein
VKVAKGRTLIEEGQIGTEFFLILSGTVGVTNRGRLLNTLGSGDFFGELAALNRGRRNATVTALSDVELLVIGRRGHNAMLEIPEFRDALLKTMASRLQTVDALLKEWEESPTLASDGAQTRDVTAEYRDFTDDLQRGRFGGDGPHLNRGDRPRWTTRG